MAKSKARYLADVLQGDGSLVFSGDLSVPTTFTIDPLPSGAGGSVTIGGDLVSTGGLGNASLENSSITINSYNTALGGTVTLVTDDVLEGGSPTNLYYTDARSRASISLTDTGGDGSLTYDSGTGAFTFTGPSAAETRAHFTAGTGVSIATGEIAIGQPVATTDAVTFSSVTGTGSSSFDTLTVTTTATVPYDNTISGLTATNVQSAITELNTLLGGGNIGSQATWNVYEFTTAGNDTSFDISTQGSPSPSYVPGYVKVYLNGLLLSESDYTAVDGTTVNFSPAITNAGQLVSVVVLDSFNTAELLRVTSIDASAATNTLTIDSLSNVGIGTTAPESLLTLENDDATLRIRSATTTAKGLTLRYNHTGNFGQLLVDHQGNNQLAMKYYALTHTFGRSDSDQMMTIDSSGRVGIGTDTPNSLLDVTRSDSTAYSAANTLVSGQWMRISNPNPAVGIASTLLFEATGDGGGNGLATISGVQTGTGSAALTFGTRLSNGSVTERMRIDSGGNVIINKSEFSSLPTGSKLNVFGDGEVFRIDGSGTTSRTIRFRNVGTNGSSNGIIASDGTLQLKNEDPNAAIYLNSVRDIEFQTTSGNGTAGHMRFYSYNTQIMHIDGANNRVGIGTNAPSAKLDVNDAGVTDNAWNTLAKFRPDLSDASAETSIHIQSYPSTTVVADRKAGIQAIDDLGVVRPLLLNKDGGNVGIGTTAPSTNLHVSGSAATIRISGDNSMTFHQDSAWNSNMYFGAHYNGSNVVYGTTGRGAFKISSYHDGDTSPQYIAFYGANSGTSGNTITWNSVGFAQDEDGNVGIGTTSPNTPLEVKSSGTGEATGIRLTDTNGTTRGNIYFGGAQNLIIHGASAPLGADAPALQFATGGSTPAVRMTVLEEGNVGIGTSPQSFSKFQVKAATDQHVSIFTNASGLTIGGLVDNGGSGALRIAGAPLHLTGQGGGAGSGPDIAIDSSGNVGIGTDDPQHDAKLDISILDETYTNAHSNLRLGSRSSSVDEAALTFATSGQALTGTIFSNYGYDNDAAYQENALRPSGYISFSNGLPNTGTGRIIFGGSQIGSTTLIEHAQFNPSGNLQFANGKGIDFSPSSNTSNMTSELLSDYEEGTWTPVVSTSVGTLGAVSGETGTYTRIGRQVTLWWNFNITDLGTGSGVVFISNASKPFSHSTSIGYPIGINRPRSGTSSICELDTSGAIYMYGSTIGPSFHTGSITYNVA